MATPDADPATLAVSASSSHHNTGTNLSILSEGHAASCLIDWHVAQLLSIWQSQQPASSPADLASLSFREKLDVGLAALDIFLQANVTGPVVPGDKLAVIQSRFCKLWIANSPSSTDKSGALIQLRKAAMTHLEVDGVSPYSYIPNLELFSLARFVFTSTLPAGASSTVKADSSDERSNTVTYNISWIRLRINVWHYKLLTQPSLGPGSNFTKSSQWSEVPSLATSILEDMTAVRAQITGDEVWSGTEAWSCQDKAYFLIEAANIHILLGRYKEAKEALKEATQTTGLQYALSGALGKRTKFQETNASQLVVLARSSRNQDLVQPNIDDENYHYAKEKVKPEALPLNDDTLLEEIQFAKKHEVEDEGASESTLPPRLAELSPDNQPQLDPLDQIILLTDATIRDAFSPVDTLTATEILPFASRVLADKSTNWQIYTQALLVRSRIDLHQGRTVERGVLQLQALADQILSDITTTGTEAETKTPTQLEETGNEVPTIQITSADQDQAVAPIKPQVPASFLPAAKSTESAPAHIRLHYIDALSTPPRWHLESELAHAWAGIGSLISSLEIFKRLRLWAEVALCYVSAAALEDESGRGSGGEEKGRSIIRWRLFHQTGQDASSNSDPDDDDVEDIMRLKASSFEGPERTPPPPNAARLWCILGDIEENPSYYERAWTVSKQRYSRAQKSLGEHYLTQKDVPKAYEAYKLATSVNRLSSGLWGRFGDICLRLSKFEEAAEAYGRAIGSATDQDGGEDARTWSNLGSALWSLYCEHIAEQKAAKAQVTETKVISRADDEEDDFLVKSNHKFRDPAYLLSKSLAAYKKGASVSHDNWRIWDNVLTLAARLQPPAVPDMVLAFSQVIRIRKTEDAIDVDVLATLLQDVVLTKETSSTSGIYEPPRGSMERLVVRLLEEQIVPLITQRPELWCLVSRLRIWKQDYAGAIDASERAWRAAVGSSGSGGGCLLPGEIKSNSADWTIDQTAWDEVVRRTDELVSLLENWGPDVESIGGKWKGKARSAIRSVMGRGKENWESSEGWNILNSLMEGLKAGN